MSESPRGVVAIVEDEEDLAELYAGWVEDRHEVRVAFEAESGLETIDETVDAVLLNRRLPGRSGDDVLAQLRADGHDAAVAMVSGVEPGTDILTLELDEYLRKPVERGELVAAVDRLVALQSQPETVRAYLAATAKRETLRTELGRLELESSDAYEHVTAAIDAFERRVVSLAETYLDAGANMLPREDRRALAADLRRLKADESRLSHTDPLWSVARNEIDEIEALLGASRQNVEVERELLAAVADGFVAKDFWLDRRILRALNLIFFDKEGDRLVINQTPLTESTELDGRTILTVSTAVRERAISISKNLGNRA